MKIPYVLVLGAVIWCLSAYLYSSMRLLVLVVDHTTGTMHCINPLSEWLGIAERPWLQDVLFTVSLAVIFGVPLLLVWYVARKHWWLRT